MRSGPGRPTGEFLLRFYQAGFPLETAQPVTLILPFPAGFASSWNSRIICVSAGGSRNALPDRYHGDLFPHSDIAPAGRLRDVSDLIDVRSGAPHDLQRNETGFERNGGGRELATEIRDRATPVSDPRLAF